MNPEPHKHKMGEMQTEKIPLYDVKFIQGKKNELLKGYDILYFKECECGFKQPVNIKRRLLGQKENNNA